MRKAVPAPSKKIMTLQRVTISHIIFGIFLIFFPKVICFLGGKDFLTRFYEVFFFDDLFLLIGGLIILISINTFLSVRSDEKKNAKKAKEGSNV